MEHRKEINFYVPFSLIFARMHIKQEKEVIYER